ncbi:MAG: HAD family acid phosphatase [Opitutae bacterium]|nr:HAD family acid phosphatase [Opitutae bacterium]
MLQRSVVPALFAGFVFALASCVNPPSRTPERAAPPIAPVAPAAPVAAPARAEPYNLYLLKQEIKTYVDDGRYEAGLTAVAGEAKEWIEQRAVRGGDKLAVVFDLDETLLSNLQHMRAMDFGYVPKLWDEWVAEADAPAIAPVRDVYLAARARNLAIVFITGRKTSDQPGTENNLRAAGLGGYTRIFYKPNGYAGTTESFKTSIRKKLVEEEGYTIVANIGDQTSDLTGGYAERTFKLPNPFYIAK